jgi:Flp pilus assembly protein TadD
MELQSGPRIQSEVMTHRKTFCKCARFFGVITASAVISACAVQTQQTNVIPPLENQPHVEIETVDFLGLSKPMKQFIGTYASEDMNDRRKAWNLAYAALDPVLFDFDYDSSVTLTAADTFRLRTGNCLSFSMMFVALAREAGLNAWFQEVKIPPEWTSVNSTFLVSMHVNAVVQVGWLKYVVDVSRTKRGDSTRTRKISDAEAEAQYYNNLGADALVKNDLALAYSYLVKATRTAPDTSYTWSNLAVVFNRNGQSEDAKNTYFTALDINPVETSAMNNLQAIYLDEGDLVLADEFGSKVERHRRKNPYYLHYLSYQAIDEQRYENAIKLLNRAIKINKEEYRFHFTLARALILNGEKNPALKSFTQAKQLASPGGEFESFSFADLKNSTHF